MDNKPQSNFNNKRRDFLSKIPLVLGASALMPWPHITQATPINRKMTIKQVVDHILKEIPGAPYERTVDVLRAGDWDQEISKLVTTMFPTIEVIEETARQGANLIVAHETAFYNHQDEIDWLQDDEVFQYKYELLKKYKIGIWRFHDYWHRVQPDGITMGNLMRLGWDAYYDPSSPRLLTLPEPQPLAKIVSHVKERFGASTVRLIGKEDQLCQTIYMAFGYMDSRMQIGAIQQYKPDLILSGETREWETVERVRDGKQLGKNTSLLILGHVNSEEAGMAYAAKWIGDKVPGIEAIHVPSGDPFRFL